MPISRFVKPDTDVLTLPNGDTLIVKRRLNRGEKAAMFAMMRDPRSSDGDVDGTMVGLARVLAYLLDWNLQDENIPIRELDTAARVPILNGLDPDYFADIIVAINAHEAKQDDAREAEKKAQGGATPSSAISPSAPDSAGHTTT